MGDSLLFNNFEENLESIKTIINRNLGDRDSKVTELMCSLPAAEGKLIRALFVLIGGGFGTIEKERLMNIAAAVELLHLATLVHDDIIDETETRRGRAAIHKRYNSKAALFSGDYLFAQSYVMFSSNCSPKSIIQVSETIKLICKSEINQYFTLNNLHSSIKDYLKRINGKCASLFSMSLSIGASESNAEELIISKLKAIGYYTGMAFQIIDDILDITSSNEILGKPSANDMKLGIYNMPVIYELKRGNLELLRLIEQKDYDSAIEMLKTSHGLEKSKRAAEKYTNKAMKIIDELPDGNEKRMLRKIIEKLLARSY